MVTLLLTRDAHFGQCQMCRDTSRYGNGTGGELGDGVVKVREMTFSHVEI